MLQSVSYVLRNTCVSLTIFAVVAQCSWADDFPPPTVNRGESWLAKSAEFRIIENPTAENCILWITQLEHEDFKVRETAFEQLKEAGEFAIPFLGKALAKSPPETKWRASTLLMEIAIQGDASTLNSIVPYLKQIESKDSKIDELLQKITHQQTLLHRAATIANLTKLGARLHLPNEVETEEAYIGFPDEIFAEDLDFLPFPGDAIVEVIDDFDLPEVIEEDPFGDAPALEGVEQVTYSGTFTTFLSVATFQVQAWGVNAEEHPEIYNTAAQIDTALIQGLLSANRVTEIVSGTSLIEFPPMITAEALEDPFGRLEAPVALPTPASRTPLVTNVAAALLPGKIGSVFSRALGVPEKTVEFDPFAEPAPVALPQIAEIKPLIEDLAPLPMPVEIAAPIDVDGIDMPIEEFDPFGDPIPARMVRVIDWERSDLPEGTLAITSQWKGGDAALASLKDLTGIHQIMLQNAPLTDKALPHLAQLSNVEHIEIAGVPFTSAGLLKMYRELPQGHIMARGKAMLGVNAMFGAQPCRLEMVTEGSPARTAGLKEDDIITQIDKTEIRDFSELTISIYEKLPGDKVTVHFERDGQKKTAVVTLAPRPQ